MNTETRPFSFFHSYYYTTLLLYYTHTTHTIQESVHRVLVQSRGGTMPNRSERIVSYLTPDEKSDLARLSQEVGKSQSDLVRDAVTEYLDRDRGDRIEEKVDQILAHIEDAPDSLGESSSHTHKQTGASETVESLRLIAQRIYENHGEVVKHVDVKRAIEDERGGDERTVGKYMRMLRERQLLFEHPSSDANVWTAEKDIWADWAETHVNSVPDVDIHDLTGPYGMGIEEYEEALEA